MGAKTAPPRRPADASAQLRETKAAWPRFGDEGWYAFSMRIDADVPFIGSANSVIGQWKVPGDDSPFVARRFDDGILHVTAKDYGRQRLVAQAQGDVQNGLCPGSSRQA
jgi:hypothetical protein